jgi:peptidoglycan/xylan/chitin deacetylase (PgdA/CDA1 family)
LNSRWLTGLTVVGMLPLILLIPLVVRPTATPVAAPLPTATNSMAATAQPTPTSAPVLQANIVPPTPTPLPPTATPLPRYSQRFLGYVPVLMYHYVREVDEAADPLGYRLSITPQLFGEQMAWLDEHNYTPLTMSDLAACLSNQQDCPARPVAITFDDGYPDQLENAVPILRRYGFPATFYIVPGLVGRPGYLDWAGVQALVANGMEVGAHTVSHVELTSLKPREARFEIVESRRILEEKLNIEVHSFSYPAGDYSTSVARMVHRAGFTNAVITRPGNTVTDLFTIPRRRILGGETIAGFQWYFVRPSLLAN